MDTSKYKKKCPLCGTEIEPKRHTTGTARFLGGVISLSGATIGFCLGGPIGAAAGAALGYVGGRETAKSMENDYDPSQWFKFKCPKCGCNWKERIHTNDDPDDPTILMNIPH